MRTTRGLAVALLLMTAAACGDDGANTPATTQESPEQGQPKEAFIAEVVADPPGDDLAPNGGEYVVIRNDATIRIDMGSWWIEVGTDRLPLGVGRQIEVGAELRVHTGPGQDTESDVFAGLDHEVLVGAGLVVLRDFAGAEVSRLDYAP